MIKLLINNKINNLNSKEINQKVKEDLDNKLYKGFKCRAYLTEEQKLQFETQYKLKNKIRNVLIQILENPNQELKVRVYESNNDKSSEDLKNEDKNKVEKIQALQNENKKELKLKTKNLDKKLNKKRKFNFIENSQEFTEKLFPI